MRAARLLETSVLTSTSSDILKNILGHIDLSMIVPAIGGTFTCPMCRSVNTQRVTLWEEVEIQSFTKLIHEDKMFIKKESKEDATTRAQDRLCNDCGWRAVSC